MAVILFPSPVEDERASPFIGLSKLGEIPEPDNYRILGKFFDTIQSGSTVTKSYR